MLTLARLTNFSKFSNLCNRSQRIRCLQSQISQERLHQTGSKPEDDEGPVKFSTSEAALKTSKYVNKTKASQGPWFEPPVLLISISVFLFYFCYLREENDLDEEMKHSLYDRIPGLEQKNIEAVIEFNRQYGNDNSKYEQRLDEIHQKKEKLN